VHFCVSPDSLVTAPCKLSASPIGIQVIRARSANAAMTAIRTLCIILIARQLDEAPAWLAAQPEQLHLGSCKKGTDIQHTAARAYITAAGIELVGSAAPNCSG